MNTSTKLSAGADKKPMKHCVSLYGVRYELHFRVEDGWYILEKALVYFSPRYRKLVICQGGMKSDGSTGGEDIVSRSWWIHDKLKADKKFSDGTPCSNWQASWVIHDVLKEEGRWVRCWTWLLAAFCWGETVGRKEKEARMKKISGVLSAVFAIFCTGLLAGCISLSNIPTGETAFGLTGEILGYGLTIKGVVQIETPVAPIVVPTNAPVVAGVDTNEAAHGLDLAMCSWVGSQQGQGAKITAALTKADTSNGGVRLEWAGVNDWALNADCNGSSCVAWKDAGGNWIAGYFDWKPIDGGSTGGWTYDAGQLNNIYVGYDATVEAGDECAFFILSGDLTQRSNAIFTKWPIGKAEMKKLGPTMWQTRWPG